jgi:hypothetical protein
MALSFDSITSLLLVDVSLGPKIIQLPYASERPGRVLTIKDSGYCTTQKSITILCSGPVDTFETGGSTYSITSANGYVTLVSDTSLSGWRIIANSSASAVGANLYVVNLSSVNANLSTISTNNIDAGNISANQVTIQHAYLQYANIENLSVNVLFANIVSTAITQDITTVTVDNALISSATISSLTAYSTNISQLYVNVIHATEISSGVLSEGISSISTAVGTLSNISLSSFSSLSTAISQLEYSTTVRYDSTIKGLGSYYLSTGSLTSSISGLGSYYLSTSGLTTTLQSTVQGLGSLGYISTIGPDSAYITSTTKGLGSLGYISTVGTDSAYITSTTQGLGRIYVSTLSLTSTVQGLGASYTSTASLTSTTAGLGNIYLSTVPPTSRTSVSQKITFNLPPYYINTPTTVNGLNLWFDSADPLNTGTAPITGATIATWYDKSLAANNATSGSCILENDGYNYINFNSNTYLIPGNFFNNNYFTVFIVESIQVLNTTTPTYIYYDNYILGVTNSGPADNSLHIAYRQGTGINGLLLAFYSDDLVATLTPITTNVTRLWSITFGQAPVPFTQSIYLFGTSQATRTASTYMSGGSGFRLGGAFGLATYKGRMREILAYQGSMGTYDRQRVEGYLAWKWGVKGNLPVNHPYYSVAPTKNFYPTSLSGLRIWLDGKDPLTTGTAPTNGTILGTWYDKSGYGYNAVGTGSPPYNSTGVSFNGSSRYYTIPYSGTHTTETVFVIFNPTNTSINQNILTGNTNASREIMFYGNKIEVFAKGTAFVNTSVLPSQGVVSMFEFTINTTTSVAYINGTVTTTSGGYTFPTEASVQLGASSGTSLFVGAMCEVMIFNTVLSTTDRQKIEGYLAWKWGITLPSGHPYISAAPTL